MPTWTIRLRIMVPSLGSRDVDFPGIVAANLQAAITAAQAQVTAEAIAGQQTAP